MDGALRLLAIEDSEADFLLMVRNLRQHGLQTECRRVASRGELLLALDEGGWDAVLSDYSLPGLDFRVALDILKERLPDLPILLVSGSIGEENAIDLLREGVWDFVLKDRPARLAQALRRSLEEAAIRKARHAAEAALLESEALYQALSEGASDAFFVHDFTGRIVACNQRACDSLGFARAELQGMNVLDLERDPDLARAQDLWARFSPGESLTLAGHHLRRDGTVFPVEVRLSMFAFRGGRLFLAMVHDVSLRVKAEEERRALETEVQHAQKLESLGSLAGGIAHDMNNVLAAILGLATTLQLKYRDDLPLVRPLATIQNAAERGRSLVKGLLDLARKGLEEPRVLDLNELVGREVDLLRRTTRQAVVFQERLEESLPPLLGEPGMLGSALINLCVNAVDAMPAGGVLTILTRRLGPDQLELAVEDTGEGMAPEVLARATEPFFTTKPRGKGTGLGLAMVYGTAKAHGGTLDIRSEVGLGTRIALRLPALPPAGAEVPEPVREVSTGDRFLRILLVDDDELIRASVPPMLNHLGHWVEAVASGREALARLEAGLAVDLVILDHNMPGLKGAQVLALLRQLRPDLSIIVATGYKDADLSDTLAAWPKVPVLAKPFTLDEMQEKLRRCVRV